MKLLAVLFASLTFLFVVNDPVANNSKETSVLKDCVRSDPSSDSLKETLVKPILVEINQVAEEIPSWRSAASLYRIIWASIVVLGLLMSGLSRLNPSGQPHGTGSGTEALPNAKGHKHGGVAANIVFILGLVVSGLTTLLHQGFATDRKGYLKSANAAANKICEIQTQVNLFRAKSFESPDQDDLFSKELTFIHDNIIPLTNELKAIHDPLLAYTVPTSGTAYAQGPTSKPSKFGGLVTGYGYGYCNLLSQSQENARQVAIDSLISSLAYETKLSFTTTDALILRNYVAKYGTVSERESAGIPAEIRYIDSVITLGGTFTDPDVLRLYLAKGERSPPPALTVDKIAAIKSQLARKNSNLEEVGFIEGTATISAPGPKEVGVVLSRPGKVQDGLFVFHFVLDSKDAFGQTPPSYSPVLTLVSVDVLGGTRGPELWTFAVLQDDKVAMKLPQQRWDASGRPTKCLMTLGPGLAYNAQATLKSGIVKLTIVGVTPKILSLK